MNLLNNAYATIDKALDDYGLDTFYALFSGGHDSLTVAHIASQHPRFGGIIHLDTGTGLPETRAYVEAVCDLYKWPLYVASTQDAMAYYDNAATYESLIQQHGLPGAAQHGNMYRYLKERPLRYLKTQLAPGGKWALVTGARSEESIRRMGTVTPINPDGSTIWGAAIHDWAAMDCTRYIEEMELPRNPVKDIMHISGECFCGCFAAAEEVHMLEIFYPDQAARIAVWEQMAREAGHEGKRCRWGGDTRVPAEQMEMFPLCHFCRGNE